MTIKDIETKLSSADKIPQTNYRGVYWKRSSKKWEARIRYNGIDYYLGLFDSDIDAAKAYDNKAFELRGDNATFNFKSNIHICEAPECCSTRTTKYDGIWMCGKHKTQYKTHGKFFDRTIYDKNKIVLENNIAFMILYDKQGNPIDKTKIDEQNIVVINRYKWYLRSDGYVATNNFNGKYMYLHHLIANIKFGEIGDSYWIDHIDRNKLNNTEENLRLVDQSQNMMNKGIMKNNNSGKVGVHWSKSNSAWCVMICLYGEHKNLGYFSSFEEAVKERKAAEIKYFGEYRAANELDYAKKNTSLPENPDYKAINDFVESVNERVVKGEV